MNKLILTLMFLASALPVHASINHGTYTVAVLCESEGSILYYYINKDEKEKIKKSVKGWVYFNKMYSIKTINEANTSKNILTFLKLTSIKKSRLKINWKKSTAHNIDREATAAEELKDFKLEVTVRHWEANVDMNWVVTPYGLSKKSNGWKHGAGYTCKLAPSFISAYL